MEWIEQEAAHKPSDDPSPCGGNVAEAHEKSGLVNRNHVLDESPIDCKEQAITDSDENSHEGRLRGEVGNLERVRKWHRDPRGPTFVVSSSHRPGSASPPPPPPAPHH